MRTIQTSRFSGFVVAQRAREAERRRDPGGVVVRALDDVGEGDVDEGEDGEQEDERGEELESEIASLSRPASRAPRIGIRAASDQNTSRSGLNGNGSRRWRRAEQPHPPRRVGAAASVAAS